ncbi:defensin-like peptide family protein [Acinetobacter baumannii 984213]|nr:defensin-like peptide family protein [Acinetobacter baumannii CI86]ETR84937.1 defensin-like peptide family protein [Acinetobacter baumannii CI79]EXA68990.1 defensin-like peptide family protein [Acinetobacter baumannii 984213]EXB21841.1 defensin-like peptide family protein [Acinetobacter baumannii 1429530]QCR58548.1 hypothetical protein D1G37_02062 [Acinetobacter baumannii]
MSVEEFLNGVCRHELNYVGLFDLWVFLNGVCRHEQLALLA